MAQLGGRAVFKHKLLRARGKWKEGDGYVHVNVLLQAASVFWGRDRLH